MAMPKIGKSFARHIVTLLIASLTSVIMWMIAGAEVEKGWDGNPWIIIWVSVIGALAHYTTIKTAYHSGIGEVQVRMRTYTARMNDEIER